MPWPKGKPRPEGAGRKRGVPNRSTEALIEKCARYSFDPFEALLLVAMKEDEPGIKLAALKEICQYLYPKRRAIEHSGEIDLQVIQQLREFVALPRDELIRLTHDEIKRLSDE